MPTAPPQPTADDEAQMRLDDGADPAVPHPLAVEPASTPLRGCGRCRMLFEGDPTLHAGALAEWWLCPACRTALLGPTRPATARSQARGVDVARPATGSGGSSC